MVYTEFYKQLAAFRKACGLTQAEMAAKLEVSRSPIQTMKQESVLRTCGC